MRVGPFSPPARTETLRPINQRGNKVQTFFSTTYHISFTPTGDGISRSLSAKRPCGHASRFGREHNPLTAPSSLIATLRRPPCAIEASGKVAATSGGTAGTEYRSVARGTRNIRFRNELTLRPPRPSPSLACLSPYAATCVCVCVCECTMADPSARWRSVINHLGRPVAPESQRKGRRRPFRVHFRNLERNRSRNAVKRPPATSETPQICHLE